MGNINVAIHVGPNSLIVPRDEPYPDRAGRVVTVTVEDASIHLSGYLGDGAVVLAADNLIKALTTVRDAAIARLSQPSATTSGEQPVLAGHP